MNTTTADIEDRNDAIAGLIAQGEMLADLWASYSARTGALIVGHDAELERQGIKLDDVIETHPIGQWTAVEQRLRGAFISA